MVVIKVTCPHCKQTLNAPSTMVGKLVKCPACEKNIQVPASQGVGPGDPDAASSREDKVPPGQPDRPASAPATNSEAEAPPPPPPLPKPQPQPKPQAKPQPRPEASADELLPWETPPELLSKAEAYRESGQVQSYTCKVEEFLEGLLRWQVFVSIKEKSKQLANLAELHIYPDLVGVVQRPEKPGCLVSLLSSFLPLQVIVLIASLVCNVTRAAMLMIIIVVVLGMMIMFFGFLGTVAVLILLVGLGAGINYGVAYLSQKNQEHIARRIRADPKSPYALKQMFKRAGWDRWRTGIGRGQTGAVMAERYWQKGDIVQLVRVDARRRLFNRSLLLLVMDEPIPDDPGSSRIGCVLVYRRFVSPSRRIYIVDFEAGSQAADTAAAAASQVLGVPVRIGEFGRVALSLTN